MKNLKPFLLLFSIIAFASCTVTTTPKEETNAEGKKDIVHNTSKIKNGITFETNTLKATQAFLMLEDGSLLNDENTVSIGQIVKMRLLIEGGFKIVNDKVKLGASEKITTNSGELVLNEEDLFKAYEADGIAPKDAEYITLMAEITKLDKLYDYFLISFRVWDKQSNAEVKGSYKLYIK